MVNLLAVEAVLQQYSLSLHESKMVVLISNVEASYLKLL